MKSCFLAAFLTAATFIPNALAQDGQSYPTKPIRLVVPSAAGGTSDAMGRIVADGISKILGQPVVVENHPGSASVIGATEVARSTPDGYTILIASNGVIAVSPLLRSDLPFKPEDLVPISQVSSAPNVLAVNAEELPVNSIAELVDTLKGSPSEYNFGSSGPGSTGHLMTELFMLRSGTELTHVTYKSSGETTTALLGGFIDMSIDTMPSLLPHIQAGTLRALGVTGAERSPELPDVPAISEVVPGVEAVAWLGIFAPAATPEAIRSELNAAISEYMRTPEAAEKLKALGATPIGSTAEEFATVIEDERANWKEVVETSGLKVE